MTFKENPEIIKAIRDQAKKANATAKRMINSDNIFLRSVGMNLDDNISDFEADYIRNYRGLVKYNNQEHINLLIKELRLGSKK